MFEFHPSPLSFLSVLLEASTRGVNIPNYKGSILFKRFEYIIDSVNTEPTDQSKEKLCKKMAEEMLYQEKQLYFNQCTIN